jgi:hypothetical protein
VHLLNETAHFVFERCDGNHTLEEIVHEADLVFKAPRETLRADIEKCLGALRDKAIIED